MEPFNLLSQALTFGFVAAGLVVAWLLRAAFLKMRPDSKGL